MFVNMAVAGKLMNQIEDLVAEHYMNLILTHVIGF